MHTHPFDLLAQTWAVSGSRRALLRRFTFTALPLLTPLLGLLAPWRGHGSEAARRPRNRTRQRRNARREQVRNDRKKTKKKRCRRAGQTPRRGQRCCSGLVKGAAGTCAPRTPARCAQSCAGCCAGEICQPGASGAACGRNGAACAACANPAPACLHNTCAACTASTQCPAGTLCDEGVCQPCDVCGSSCFYATPAEAVTDPAGPATIRICAGDYSGSFTIRRDVQLIGTGDGAGADDTILTGTGIVSVVTILQGLHVTLRRLRITGGEATGNGGGILANGSQVTLRDCSVTGNRAAHGGGILNTLDGQLTLDHSHVTANTAVSGGGIYNNIDATLTLLNGSHVTGNRATQTYGNPGGGILNNGVLHPAGGTITDNTPDDCIDGVNSGTGCPPQ